MKFHNCHQATIQYGKNFITGKKTAGFDCVMIAGLSKADGAKLGFSDFCGLAGLGSADGQVIAASNAQKTLCSKYSIL